MPYIIRKSGNAGGEIAEKSVKPTTTQRVKLPPPVNAPKRPTSTTVVIQQPHSTK